MATLTCPTCGNTQRWRNAYSAPDGSHADCRDCGDYVEDPTITSAIRIRIAETDSTQFQSDDSQTNYF